MSADQVLTAADTCVVSLKTLMAEKIAIMLSNFVLEKYDRRFLKKQETRNLNQPRKRNIPGVAKHLLNFGSI